MRPPLSSTRRFASGVSVLASARRIYQRAGFTLVREQPEHSYGHDLIAEDWARSLSG
jgi:hypothetical protein